MAKKSAKSKGYRKTVQKKPFLTKKEILALVAIVAAIVLVVVLFNLLYDDGFVRAGEIQPDDVVSFAGSDARNRYKKLAEAHDLEGFTRDGSEGSDAPRIIHTYTPDGETDHIESISLSGSFIPADQQYENAKSGFGAESMTYTEQQTVDVQGHDAYVFAYTYDYYSEEAAGDEAPAGAPAAEDASGEEEASSASNRFSQTLMCYVDVDGYTVCFHIYRTGEDDSFYLPEDQIADELLSYADKAFTIVEPGAK